MIAPGFVKVLRVSTAWLLLTGLQSCTNLAESVGLNITNISDLQQQRSLDATIYLKGRVQERAPFLETGSYQLRDSTGAIWVFTKQAVPKLGEQLVIKGVVRYQSIPVQQLAGKDVGELYVEELEQLERIQPQQRSPEQPAEKTPNTPNSQP